MMSDPTGDVLHGESEIRSQPGRLLSIIARLVLRRGMPKVSPEAALKIAKEALGPTLFPGFDVVWHAYCYAVHENADVMGGYRVVFVHMDTGEVIGVRGILSRSEIRCQPGRLLSIIVRLALLRGMPKVSPEAALKIAKNALGPSPFPGFIVAWHGYCYAIQENADVHGGYGIVFVHMDTGEVIGFGVVPR